MLQGLIDVGYFVCHSPAGLPHKDASPASGSVSSPRMRAGPSREAGGSTDEEASTATAAFLPVPNPSSGGEDLFFSVYYY